MNKFLKESEKRFFEEKQKYIREKLTFHLTDHLKENEYEFKANNNEPLIYNECTSSLCFTIEAIFLHGLKDTFLQLLSSLGNDEAKPNPSFWNFVIGFLHKQDIKDIQSLQQVTTEVGFCRVFVRKALNDSLLSSYFQNIRKSTKSLKSYYHNYAFLFDSELSETAENLLRGIESLVVFNLPYNSSLLNSWQDTSLELSGLYTPALKSLPLPVGVDIVASLTSATTTANLDIPHQQLAHPDIFMPSISNSFLSKSSDSFTNDLDDDPKFAKLIRDIDTPENEDISELMQQSTDEDLTENLNVAMQDKPVGEPMQESQDEATPENENERRLGNLIDLSKNSWADPIKEKAEQSEEEPKEPLPKHSLSTRSSAIDNHSFESLWNEKQRKSSTNFQEVWSKFQKTLNEQQLSQNKTDELVEKDENLDFEVIKAPLNDQEKMNELQQMVEILCRLSTECGLDSQGFVCKGCRSPLVEISKATVCGFDGFYYCTGCISNDKFAIPARIIFNWDFLQYPVSTRAANFFADHQFKPFIDLKILNPDIYSYIDEMNKLQKLRIQLNFLRAYIFTCSEGTVAELQKLLYGKEYIYETIHLYSVADLYLIQNGSLEDMLKRVVAFGREHCVKCILCKERGYHCEYCRKSKIIYPFDVDDVMRCNQCGSVSHLKCYNSLIPCPKCERKRRRQLNAALEAENPTN